MKAARVTTWDSPPAYIDVPDLPTPSPTELQLKMLAVGIPNVVRGRAARLHPTAFKADLPYDPSIDGVGLDEKTGDLYYVAPLVGSLLSERINADRQRIYKLPPGTDPTTVAGLANPMMSSWMAITSRIVGGCKGRTVVIIGATSASGRCAAFVARHLGACRIIGISRTEETLAAVEGLDNRVLLRDPLVFPVDIGPVHIVLDWVGGPVAVQVMQSAQIDEGENLQYVRCGGLSKDMTIQLPMRLLNLRPIRVMASGMGSFSKQDMIREAPGLASMMASMQKAPFEILATPMKDVELVWESEEARQKRLVLLP